MNNKKSDIIMAREVVSLKKSKTIKEINPEEDKIYNQDNNGVWINPLLHTKGFKLYFLFMFLVFLFFIINGFIKESINYVEKIILAINVFFLLTIIIIFLLRRLIIKWKIKREENQILKISDLKYYRDILDESSVGVLSYCYNRKINYEDIIVATILIFQRNNVFQIDNVKKTISLSNNNKAILNESESYFYEKIKKIGNTITFEELKNIIEDGIFKNNFINLIKKDSKQNGYFKTEKSNTNFFLIVILIYSMSILLVASFLAQCEIIGKKTAIISILFIFLLLYFAYIERKNNYIRTLEGIKITAKLEGLKNYIKDFSNMEDRDLKEILLWDYYMVYAIIFNLKGRLDKEVKELYRLFSE